MQTSTTLGLRANWRQFSLLVVVNGFVGAMVGVERTLLPILGRDVFLIGSQTGILTFLVSFGVVKAVSNAAAGRLADVQGRKRVLIAGWLAGIPVPILLMFAPPPHWWLIVLANGFLGVNQGLCWSMTVVSKIDLVGPRGRGLATGLNEFGGYGAVGVTAFLAASLSAAYGLPPIPFLMGVVAVVAGPALSASLVRETKPFSDLERRTAPPARGFRQIFAEASWRNRSLFACAQGGLVNNLNDAVAWGLLPLFLLAAGLRSEEIGLVAGLYPLTWGVLQLLTGPLSDVVGRKRLIVIGMWLKGIGFFLFVLGTELYAWIGASLLLGLGTAMVYPTFLSAVSDVAHPAARAATLGVYRFWRDLGFAVGAIVVGLLADVRGLDAAMLLTGTLTAASGAIVLVAMRETRPRDRGAPRNA